MFDSTSPKLAAVLVAALLHWLFGALWFTVFKQQWLIGVGRTAEQLAALGQPAWLPHVVTLFANFALAYVLGWLIPLTGKQTVVHGVQVAAILWVCVVASVFASVYVFEARSLQIFAINTGYPLVGMLLMGIVLGAWKS